MPSKKPVSLPLLSLFLLASTALAAEPQSLADCARVADNEKRLVCYDLIAGRSTPSQAGQMDRAAEALAPAPVLSGSEAIRNGAAVRDAAVTDAAVTDATTLATSAPAVVEEEGVDLPATLSMTQHWELGAAGNRGTFNFRPHRSNYLLLKHSNSPNAEPYRQFVPIAPEAANVSHTELAFQLGFKTKLMEDVLARPVDLWFGYTQQSFWQAANRRASSPFRETNFQPELMAVAPLNFRLLGMDARFLNLGFVHQSNGQAASLSRSWNRVYAQIGFERGDLSLLTRVWKRIEEDRSEDDNPDIIDYMGRGDVQATYRWQGHELSALARYNFRSGHGAAELGWAFPLSAGLKGYVQYFSGYGQSLIDYDHAQQSLGLGVMLNY